MLDDEISRIPILYDNTRWINTTCIKSDTAKLIDKMLLCVAKYAGILFLQRAVFELKFKPKDAVDSDEEEEQSRLKQVAARVVDGEVRCSNNLALAPASDLTKKCHVCLKSVGALWCGCDTCEPLCDGCATKALSM